jgi:hypothetical protein
MIKVLKETTDWPYKGVYHVNSSNELVAFQPTIDSPVKTFKEPMKNFSKSYRKFELIKEYEETFDSDVITVKGSNGNTYIIRDGKCSCPGFTFRGRCKHVEENS